MLLGFTGPSSGQSDTSTQEQDHHNHQGDVDLAEGEESLDAVAQILADSAGGTVDEAKNVLLHQERVDKVLARLYDRFPEVYGGKYSNGFAGVRSTILVKGEITKEIRDALGDLGGDIELRSSRFSEADLREASVVAHERMVELGFEQVTSGYDVEFGRVEIEVSGEQTRPIHELESNAIAAVRASDALELRLPEMEVSIVEGPLFTDSHLYGGDQLRDGSVNECQSAFSGTRSGNTGVLTAGHCDGLDGYMHRWSSTTDHNMTHATQHVGSSGDFEFKNVGTSTVNRIYVSWSSTMLITSVQQNAGIDKDDWVCVWGRKSQTGVCVQIKNPDTTFTSNGVTTGRIVRTQPAGLEKGDSGAPWYTTNRAWGIYKGFYDNGDEGFSRAYLAEDVLGVTIDVS